jgi:hypothetical protein
MKIKQDRSRLLIACKLSVGAALTWLAFGCVPAFQCGSWVFNGTPQGDHFPLSSAFTFTPASCESDCNVQTDAMVQITAVYDATDHTYLYAGSGDQARADAHGWNIDRIDGAAYGWYGLLNDGATFASFWNTTGGNYTPNTLYDEPGGLLSNTIFYAVDVAVCFRADTCTNKILGYYFWSWIIDNNGNGTKFLTAPAWTDAATEFQSALASWNAWAPTSGPENGNGVGGPTDPPLPNAVNFPSLSDL